MENTASEYQTFHQRLVTSLLEQIRRQPPFVATDSHAPEEDDKTFIQHLNTLSTDLNASEQGFPLGQWVITTIVARYPHITPQVPRDLFWFFGGDCLHYLGEEEVALFQKLDESFHTQDAESETPLSYEDMRALVFELH